VQLTAAGSDNSRGGVLRRGQEPGGSIEEDVAIEEPVEVTATRLADV
jgi:hypothetical protein